MKQKKMMIIALAVCLVAVAGMIVALCLTGGEREAPQFVAPPFDSGAVQGIPTGAGDSWMPIYKEGMSFSAHVCGRVVIKDAAADLYFTNDAGNECWMKLRITDEEGNILGETGLLKPGEYVKSISFQSVPTAGTKIKMKIMAYEPETYYSAGAVTLNTVVGGA